MSEAPSRVCETCGDSVPEESQFCPGCGTAVAGHEENGVDTISGQAAGQPAKSAMKDPAVQPEPTGGEIFLDWSEELVATVREAAEIQGVSVENFIRHLVEPAAKKVLEANKGLLTLDKSADLLGVTRKEVIQMITAGKLRARKVDNEWKVDQRSLLELSTEETVAYDDVELELHHLVKTSGLMGLETEGGVSQGASATLCYVNQDGILVCPQAAWRKLGPKQIIAEARDAVRRYMKRRDRDLG